MENNTKAKYNFNTNLIRLSYKKSNKFEEVINEWVIIHKEKRDNKDRICICNHKIQNVTYIYNRFNENTIIVGSHCCKKFKLNIKQCQFPELNCILKKLLINNEYKIINNLVKYSSDNYDELLKIIIRKYDEYNKLNIYSYIQPDANIIDFINHPINKEFKNLINRFNILVNDYYIEIKKYTFQDIVEKMQIKYNDNISIISNFYNSNKYKIECIDLNKEKKYIRELFSTIEECEYHIRSIINNTPSSIYNNYFKFNIIKDNIIIHQHMNEKLIEDFNKKMNEMCHTNKGSECKLKFDTTLELFKYCASNYEKNKIDTMISYINDDDKIFYNNFIEYIKIIQEYGMHMLEDIMASIVFNFLTIDLKTFNETNIKSQNYINKHKSYSNKQILFVNELIKIIFGNETETKTETEIKKCQDIIHYIAYVIIINKIIFNTNTFNSKYYKISDKITIINKYSNNKKENDNDRYNDEYNDHDGYDDDHNIISIIDIIKDPYRYVKLYDGILTYYQAKNIDIYFNGKYKMYELNDKIHCFINYTLYNYRKYNINKDNIYLRTKEPITINLQSHIIPFYKILQLILLEFNNITIGELIEYFNEKEYRIIDDVEHEEIEIFSTVFENFNDISENPLKKFMDSVNKKLVQCVCNMCKGVNNYIYTYLEYNVTTNEIYDIETSISKFILDNMEKKLQININERSINHLNEKQKYIYTIMKYKLCCLFGGPGTGKTYTITKYCKDNKSQYSKIVCLSLTGSAMKNLYSSLIESFADFKCDKNHDLDKDTLEIEKCINCEKYNNIERSIQGYTLAKFNVSTLKISNDNNKVILFIIDEISMCDYDTFYRFIMKLKYCNIKNYQIIMIGDYNQLPPIGLGDICRDLYNYTGIGEYSKNRLELYVNKRATKGKVKLIYLINNIKEKKMELLKNAEKNSVVFQDYDSVNDLNNLIKERLNREYHIGGKSVKMNIKNNIGIAEISFRIISPLNKYVDICNNIAQNHFNNNGIVLGINLKRYCTNNTNIKAPSVRINDLVVSSNNKYDKTGKLTYVNGSEFIVKDYNDMNGEFTLLSINTEDENDIIISKTQFIEDFRLGYSITTHKAQGKSISTVFYIFPNNNIMRSNTCNGFQNFYTGVSRSKDKVIIFKDKNIKLEDVYNSNYQKKTNLFGISN